jgi:hypothetical protein
LFRWQTSQACNVFIRREENKQAQYARDALTQLAGDATGNSGIRLHVSAEIPLMALLAPLWHGR